MGDLVQAVYRLAGGRLCAPTPTQYACGRRSKASEIPDGLYRRALERDATFAVQCVRGIKGLSCDVPQAAFNPALSQWIHLISQDERCFAARRMIDL